MLFFVRLDARLGIWIESDAELEASGIEHEGPPLNDSCLMLSAESRAFVSLFFLQASA
jgi:hypothetical protein